MLLSYTLTHIYYRALIFIKKNSFSKKSQSYSPDCSGILFCIAQIFLLINKFSCKKDIAESRFPAPQNYLQLNSEIASSFVPHSSQWQKTYSSQWQKSHSSRWQKPHFSQWQRLISRNHKSLISRDDKSLIPHQDKCCKSPNNPTFQSENIS